MKKKEIEQLQAAFTASLKDVYDVLAKNASTISVEKVQSLVNSGILFLQALNAEEEQMRDADASKQAEPAKPKKAAKTKAAPKETKKSKEVKEEPKEPKKAKASAKTKSAAKKTDK